MISDFDDWLMTTSIGGGDITADYAVNLVDQDVMLSFQCGYFNNGGGPCYIVSLRAVQEEKGVAKTAEVTIPAKGDKPAFKAMAAIPGDGGNNITVYVTVDKDPNSGKALDTFSITVGEETKIGLTMKKGDNNIANASFGSIVISDVTGTATPAEGARLAHLLDSYSALSPRVHRATRTSIDSIAPRRTISAYTCV